jgi:hypothetical protein
MRAFAAVTPGLIAFTQSKCKQRTVHCQDAQKMMHSAKDQGSGGLIVARTESTVQQAKTLSATRFERGNYWVWLYRSPSGEPYSWERYTVCESGPDADVVIEMSSRFSEDDKYSTHHRMKLSLVDCVAAKAYHKTWRFHEFSYKLDGEWCEAPFNDNVQAFEEKFNVFLMVRDALLTSHPHPSTTTTKMKPDAIVIPGDMWPTGLVQTKRHDYTNAWYAHHHHQHAGLAAFKEFTEDHQEEGRSYTFELIEMGRSSGSKGQINEA